MGLFSKVFSKMHSPKTYSDASFEEQVRKDGVEHASSRIAELVNEKIREDLPVVCKEMTLEEAKQSGALGVFEHKYGEVVKVYFIGNYSKELCAGPHVSNTKDLGRFKIIKEESSSAGVRRIKAVLDN